MKKRQTWKGAVVAAGLALITMLAPAGAQTDVPAKRGDSQKPVVDTYNKQPDPSGKNQDFDAATYEKAPDPQGEDQKPDAATYNKKPDPSGVNQKLDALRYDQDNDASDGLPAELQMKVLEGSVEE